MQIINFSIDLAKIDKTKIKETDKGQKFYQLTGLVEDTTDKYGNNFKIIEPQTKEDRESKKQKVYIGNGKVVFSTTSKSTETSTEQASDLPF